MYVTDTYYVILFKFEVLILILMQPFVGVFLYGLPTTIIILLLLLYSYNPCV